MVSRLASEGRMAASLGVADSFKEFGDMLGPLLIGVLAQGLGIRSSFVICGALGVLSIGLLKFAPTGPLAGGRHQLACQAVSL